jgi:hypothetical protein
VIPSEHPNLFSKGGSIDSRSNLPLGEKLRDLAIEAAKLGADPAWKIAALVELGKLAQTRETFTADDVLLAIPKEITTHEKRALGAVMQFAARQDWIVATDDWTPSRIPARHARPVRVWKSKIRRGA